MATCRVGIGISAHSRLQILLATGLKPKNASHAHTHYPPPHTPNTPPPKQKLHPRQRRLQANGPLPSLTSLLRQRPLHRPLQEGLKVLRAIQHLRREGRMSGWVGGVSGTRRAPGRQVAGQPPRLGEAQIGRRPAATPPQLQHTNTGTPTEPPTFLSSSRSLNSSWPYSGWDASSWGGGGTVGGTCTHVCGNTAGTPPLPSRLHRRKVYGPHPTTRLP